ncbi:MAG: hypothetical protein ACI84C_000757 [Flavobacteriales bacterium]|jgi:hypothetical protein
MAKLEAKIISHKDIAEFNRLAEEHGGVFSQPKWFDTFGHNALRIGLFQMDGQLVGGFLCTMTPLKVLKVLSPLRFTPHAALFFKQNTSNAAGSTQYEKSVGKAISTWILEQSVKTVLLPFPWSYDDMQSFTWDGFRVAPKYTYRLSLEPSGEAIRANFSQSAKSAIKKAEKSEIVVTICDDAQKVHELLNETLQSKNDSFDLGLTLEEIKNLFETELAFALVANCNEKPIATGVFVHDRLNCYYLLGGVNRKYSKLEGGTAIIWSGIQKAKEIGCEVFDFEGSMNPGIEHFFRGFGGKLTPYFQIIKANKLQRRILRLGGRKEF